MSIKLKLHMERQDLQQLRRNEEKIVRAADRTLQKCVQGDLRLNGTEVVSQKDKCH